MALPAELGSALDAVSALAAERRPIALFLDYDGTLTPIVARPEDAVLAPEMRAAIRDAAAALPLVAVVSGRDRRQVQDLVGLPDLGYVGSHGFEILPPGADRPHEIAAEVVPALAAAEAALRERLVDVRGAEVERKRFSLAVHYRRVAPEGRPLVAAAVADVMRGRPELVKGEGKAVFDIVPNVDWDKGRAMLWLLDRVGLTGALAIHLGDDRTDEDAFRRLSGRGVGILVGAGGTTTAATLRLRDPGEVLVFLRRLPEALRRRPPAPQPQ